MPNLEGYKQIAAYVTEKTGRPVSENSMRKAKSHPTNPLHVRRFMGRAMASTDEVDRWIVGAKFKRPGSGR